MTSNRRETIWLGASAASGEDDDLKDYDIGTEDDMVSVSCTRADGSELEVFIGPNLFAAIRDRMSIIERIG